MNNFTDTNIAESKDKRETETKNILRLIKKAYDCYRYGDIDEYTQLREKLYSIYLKIPEDNTLWGEYMLILALDHLVEPTELRDFYRKALVLTGGRSKALCHNEPMTADHYEIFVTYYRMGRGDEISGILREVCELYDKLAGGGMGVSFLYDARLAYYRGEFDTSLKLTRKAFSEAVRCGDGMTALGASELIGCLGKFNDSELMYQEMNKCINLIISDERTTPACREMVAYVRSIIDMAAGVMTSIPDKIKTGDFGVIYLSDYPEAYRITEGKIQHVTFLFFFFAHIIYLSYSGAYVKALNAITTMEKCCSSYYFPLVKAYCSLFRVGCFLLLDKPRYAQKALSDMIEIVASDNLWLIPSEFLYSVMGKQISQEAERYGRNVVDKMLDIGETYSARLDILHKLVCSFGQVNTLTKREFQIASMIINRETYAEIAQKLEIGENTVKFHIKNVYNKLGIKNRKELPTALGSVTPATMSYWVRKK